MIDRRILEHPSLAGTDFVLEGASVRDRFLTAFVLQHNGALQATAWLPDRASPAGLTMPLFEAAEESFGIGDESSCELTIQLVDEWPGSDDDEDDM